MIYKFVLCTDKKYWAICRVKSKIEDLQIKVNTNFIGAVVNKTYIGFTLI